MRHTIRSSHLGAALPIALALLLVAGAMPAAAKVPVIVSPACTGSAGKAPSSSRMRALCVRHLAAHRQTTAPDAASPTGSAAERSGVDAPLIGGVAVLVLLMGSGLVIATRQRGVHRGAQP